MTTRFRVLRLAVGVLLVAVSGRRGPEPPPSAPTTDLELPTRFPAVRRIVAVGDLDGDPGATRSALRLAGAIDAGDRWIGSAPVVVQLGDVLDLGDDEHRILGLTRDGPRVLAARTGRLSASASHLPMLS